MLYTQTDAEKELFVKALKNAISIPYIDDIEDFVVEALWAYAKGVKNSDPFTSIRSKRLYDVVDTSNRIGWSVKSIQRAISDMCEFELVIQRADIIKKRNDLGFPNLSLNSKPSELGAALLRHWQDKIYKDAEFQNVDSKRVLILLKTVDKKNYAILEEDIALYKNDELRWQWTDDSKTGLQGIREADGMCVYRWYPNQKQFFERFILPTEAYKFKLKPHRLDINSVVHAIAPFLEDNQ